MTEITEINDVRTQKEFKGISFSQFKKSDVKRELLINLYKSKIEPVCYWSAELICAGHYSLLWDIIISFYTDHIYIGHPRLIVYLELRINDFKTIVRNGYVDQEIRLRNNEKLRKLFCEIMCILCESKKSHAYTNIKVKPEDFDLTYMTDRFKAPSISYAEAIYKPDDPKELFVAVNELTYNLTDEIKNSVTACYWVEWIIEFENICKKKREKCICERREFPKVESKYQMDIIWIIWDIILAKSEMKSLLIKRIIMCTLNIFCLKYITGCHKRKKGLIYFAISILTEPFIDEPDIIKDKDKLKMIIQNVNKIYKQIKKNEQAPDTEYLFHNINSRNLEQTIKKLEHMNNLGAEYIPRTNT